MHGQLSMGLTSLDEVLAPLRGERVAQHRTIRRVGPSVELGYFKHPKGRWRRLRSGTCAHAGVRFWPHRVDIGQGADTEAGFSTSVRPRKIQQAQLWSRGLFRGLWGSEGNLMALGGWYPELGATTPSSTQAMGQTILGYEDIERRGSLIAQAQAGINYLFSSQLRVELFASISHIAARNDKEPKAQSSQLLRSMGLAVAHPLRMGSKEVVLAYQLALRLDHPRDSQLHLLSLTL